MTVTVIGGAAIGLKYDTQHATSDVDLTPIQDEGFWEAVKRTNARMTDPVPVQSVGLFAGPYDYESRCTHLAIDGLKLLTLLVPEAHDLALMKVARGLTHDLEAVEDVHNARPLDLEILVARYYETLTQVTGSLEDFKLSFLSLVDRLFGRVVAARVEARLENERPPRIESV